MHASYNGGRLIAIAAIILGILLSLFAIGFFTDQHPYGLPNYRESLKLPCGLTVYSPKEQTKVKFPLTLYGYANGCGWTLAGDSVGTIEVLGMNGIVLYRGSLPKKQSDDDTPIYFERTISLVVPLGHTRGVVVLKNNGLGTASERVVIPVLFK